MLSGGGMVEDTGIKHMPQRPSTERKRKPKEKSQQFFTQCPVEIAGTTRPAEPHAQALAPKHPWEHPKPGTSPLRMP